MTCQNCNSPNADAARFCSSCGAEVIPPAAPSAATDDGDEITRVQRGAGVRVTHAESASLIGREIEGKYRVVGKVGAGGMGTVYRAQRILIGDEVAIKVLHSQHVSEPQATARFRREAQAAARLKHPNAVSVYDFGVSSDGLVYLVMELVEGQSLRQIIRRQGPLTPSAAADIITQACAALDEAHRNNIVHRDLKPDNIIVNASVNGLRVKVLDFGIAKLRDLTAGNLTQTGSVMGTPHYMSPEQCLGEELDHRSDVYSLGIVLYEMLAGVVPFNSPISTAVIVQHVNQAPPSLRAVNLSISADLEKVVLHALEKKREARPQTAGTLAEELNGALHSHAAANFNPVQNARTGSEYSSAVGRHPVMMPTMVMPRPPNATPAATHGSPQGKGKQMLVIVAIAVLAVSCGIGALWLLAKNETKLQAGAEPTATPSQNNKRVSTTPDRLATVEQAAPISETEAQLLLESWKRSWEAKDLYAYSNYYDESFIGRNYSSRSGYVSMTRAQWLRDKEQKFRRSSFVSVGIGNPSTRTDENGTSVSFPQDFRSSGYSDKGIKTLYLRRNQGGVIKIIREDFVPNGTTP